MGGFFSSPSVDNSAREAREKAEAEARAEQAQIEANRKEEESALRRGLRGRRALLSNAGGELGFSNTLGI